MPWIVPNNRLDTEQREVLDKLLRVRSPHWIRGFAGSGKSVVLIHGLRELLIQSPGATACVIGFTHSLCDMLRSGLPDNARHIPVMTYHQFQSRPARFDYIFVDEVQDLESRVLQLLRQNSGTLVMAGDEEQSIYENRVGPVDIQRITEPATHSLSSVYRLTEKLKKVVATILPKSRVHSARNARLTADVRLTLAQAANTPEELSWVCREANRITSAGDPVAVLFPKRRLIDDFIVRACTDAGVKPPSFEKGDKGRGTDYEAVNRHLATHGLVFRYLGSGHGRLDDSDRGRIVYLMTYHSAKGLDFETVFLPGLDARLSIWKSEDEMERRLFYVAATRSRRNLFISYSGTTPHRFILGMPQDLIEKIPIRPASAVTPTENFDDIF